ncbi:MAG: YgaP family membrane protein [Terriglobales bacterium]
MCTERWIRLFAGSMILISLALAHWVSGWWYGVTIFVGLNLLQSSLTRFCPLEKVLQCAGVSSACDRPGAAVSRGKE